MNKLLASIARHAEERPNHIALCDGAYEISYRDLLEEIERVAPNYYLRRVGVLLANGCAWAIIDLAIRHWGLACIPMPSFFSDAQLQHIVTDAGLDLIITDQPSRVIAFAEESLATEITVAGRRLDCFELHAETKIDLPPHTTKITYTSGTTGQPKGVCLTDEAIDRATLSISAAVEAGPDDRSIALLPFSTLLANIGGIYAPLYSGSTAFLPDLADCGMDGATSVRSERLIEALHRFQPTVTILVPHLLKILIEAAEQGARLPSSLRFIAVGGAPAAPALMARARAMRIPVYEGYGLSEAASVVSLNVPGHNRGGSVGRPLPHVAVRIADDGEIMVSGNLFRGYLGQDTRFGDEWPTGDLGFLDDHGYLHIIGRKKTSFATAHGRKLSPEWIESELTGNPAIAQAVLFGEGRNFNVAVIVPSNVAAATKIGHAVIALNKTLPDYARVTRWIIADEPFSIRNGLANGACVPDRQAIAIKYSADIERLYQREPSRAVL